MPATMSATRMSTVAPSSTTTVAGNSANPWSRTLRLGTKSRMEFLTGLKKPTTQKSTTTLKKSTQVVNGLAQCGLGGAFTFLVTISLNMKGAARVAPGPADEEAAPLLAPGSER